MGDKTVVDICEADESGTVSVRLKKFNDDGSWVYHRTTIPAGADAAVQMAAVNTNIQALNEKGIEQRATMAGKKGTYFDSTEAHALVSDEDIARVVAVHAKADVAVDVAAVQ